MTGTYETACSACRRRGRCRSPRRRRGHGRHRRPLCSTSTTGRYVDHPAIFIGDDGRIQSIGDAAHGADGRRARKHIDLARRTLLPGLIDMHVHLTSLAEIGGYQGLKYTDSFWAGGRRRQCEEDARRRLHHRAQRRLRRFRRRRAQAGDRRRLDRRARGSCRRPMRSARPAAIATTPACRLRYDKKGPAIVDSPERGAREGALACTNMAPR